jgi:hypothetical protein
LASVGRSSGLTGRDIARIIADVRASRPDTYYATVVEIERLAKQPYVDGVSAAVRIVAPTPPWLADNGTEWLLRGAR